MSAGDARAVAVGKAGQNIVVRGQCGSSGTVINAGDIARKRRRKRRRRDVAGDLACVEPVAENGLVAAVCEFNGDVAEYDWMGAGIGLGVSCGKVADGELVIAKQPIANKCD